MSDYKESRHRRLKGNTMLTVMTVILGCAVIVLAVLLFKKLPAAKLGPSSTAQQSTSTAAGTSSKASKAAVSSSQGTASSQNAGLKNLNQALFIGDAFTDGLTVYGGINASNVIAEDSLSAYSAVNHKYTINGKKQKVSDAAAAKKPGSIYILIGSNDIDQGYSMTGFTKYYGELIADMQSGCPNAKIYVQSIFPVTAAYEKKYVTNTKIEKYNTALKSLCTDKGVTYLDVASALKGVDGKLPSSASSDGLHLKKAYYQKWLSYLSTGSAGGNSR